MPVQITQDELMAEAGRMALEIRFLAARVAELEAELTELRAQGAPGNDPGEG